MEQNRRKGGLPGPLIVLAMFRCCPSSQLLHINRDICDDNFVLCKHLEWMLFSKAFQTRDNKVRNPLK